MTFRGLNEHSLDSKDRITVPAQYRGALAGGIVLIRSVEPCVEVWPADAAEEMERRTLSALNPMSRDARRIQRRFFAHSESAELDAAGRIRLSRHLVEHAGLDGRCIVSGMGTRLEIWAPERWLEEDEENEQRTPELTESLAAQQAPPAAGSA
ncbi:MAG: division/cell wall cluster transcriptional repressor MraZ [Acidobacteria bacterium]|nr:MAG: division/cell wall cluster transcriptional repressor MraZ [Acidobacteriota bacterium]GIK78342.1 MAG: transcriptional regulator MraZ [Actinomycetes bacterium]